MLWCIIPLLLLLTAAMAHAETSRHPEQIPYPEETIIPLWKLTDNQYALLRTIYAGISACQAEIPLPTRPTMEELDPVMDALNCDYPELIQFYGPYRYRYVGSKPQRITCILPQYCLTLEETKATWQRVMQVVTRVVKDCGAEIARPRPRATPAATPASRREQLMQIWTRPSETVMQMTRSTQSTPSLERIWLNPATAAEPAPQPRPVTLSGKLRNVWISSGKHKEASPTPALPRQSVMARRAEFLHDALVACTRYRSRKCGDPHVLSPKGALLDGLSNCVGYTKALMLLYRTAGIPCGYVEGTTGSNHGSVSTHAWNVACIDGKYTQIDATWSDLDKHGYVTHFYYGLSDEQMGGDHHLLTKGHTPACSDHVNWHRLHGCYVRTKEEAFAVLRSHLQRKDKLISLRFADQAVYAAASRDVPAFVHAYNACSKGDERLLCRYSYTQEDSQLCLLLNLMPEA